LRTTVGAMKRSGLRGF